LEGVADPQVIETKFFSRIDNEAAPILKRLVACHLPDLDNDQREAWTRFIMSLNIRGPHSLREVNTVLDGLARTNIEREGGQEYRATKRPEDPDSVYEFARRYAPELFGNAHKVLLPSLIDSEIIGERIINMRWAIMDLSAAQYTLLVGDRPYTTSHGVGQRACLLGLPLSPTRLFAASPDIEQLRGSRHNAVTTPHATPTA
jgi:hypothetical protein